MKLLVWGLGYVGSVTAACMADLGHDVVGVEPNATKRRRILDGQSPVVEPGLEAVIARAVSSGRLHAVEDGVSCVQDADVSLICVGTPLGADGRLMLNHIAMVAADIAAGLRDSSRYHVIALRSTVPPGTVRALVGKTIERLSGKTIGRDFGLAMNPEFMREASALHDFSHPPYTVIGASDEHAGRSIAALYTGIDAPVHQVGIEEAELLKMCNNAFHGLKIGFANEIGRLCDEISVDARRVMELVCLDRKLNISPMYLKPGFAFGGSCLPKDITALTGQARRQGLELPILQAVLPSNQLHIERARRQIMAIGASPVGVLGLAFKAGTDDLRASPMITLVRDLWQDGVDVLVCDPDIDPEAMLGSNLEYLERQLPQIHQILQRSVREVLERAEAVVLGHNRPEFVIPLKAIDGRVPIIDLVRTGEFSDLVLSPVTV